MWPLSHQETFTDHWDFKNQPMIVQYHSALFNKIEVFNQLMRNMSYPQDHCLSNKSQLFIIIIMWPLHSGQINTKWICNRNKCCLIEKYVQQLEINQEEVLNIKSFESLNLVGHFVNQTMVTNGHRTPKTNVLSSLGIYFPPNLNIFCLNWHFLHILA